MQTTNFDISKLTVAERIQLAQDLWDSVASETTDLPLTEGQRTELDRRLADFARNPALGEPWDTVRERIQRLLRKAG